MTESGDGDEHLSLLVGCLRDPERGMRRLPAVVGLLEADDERTRLAAAWTCCLVATDHPDTVEYLVRRLADRLREGTVSLELTHALEYLADRYPETVESVLDDLAAEAAEPTGGPALGLPEPGRFTRAHDDSREPQRRGVGRVRVPGSANGVDPRRTYTTGQPTDREVAERRTQAGDDASAAENAATGDEQVGGPSADGHQAADESRAGDAADRGMATGDAGEVLGERTDVAAIADRSRFDQLHVLATRARGRYSIDYRALVGQGSAERAIALRLLRVPDDATARPAMEERIREAMDQWAAIDDHDHVVALLDWSLEPRPWLATTYPGETLTTQDLAPREALADAISLAGAVAHAHRNDVVHAGIDPGNVAYPGEVLEANDQEPPLLNNPGLLSVYRYHVDPATVLDPRFAAPEYFDRQFGQIDATTDIYQLGAVVFAMVTGRPPYDGSFETVRAAVTDETVPVPGDHVSGLPPGLDDAVAKAMAPRTLHRYETVEHFQQDLVGVREAGDL